MCSFLAEFLVTLIGLWHAGDHTSRWLLPCCAPLCVYSFAIVAHPPHPCLRLAPIPTHRTRRNVSALQSKQDSLATQLQQQQASMQAALQRQQSQMAEQLAKALEVRRPAGVSPTFKSVRPLQRHVLGSVHPQISCGLLSPVELHALTQLQHAQHLARCHELLVVCCASCLQAKGMSAEAAAGAAADAQSTSLDARARSIQQFFPRALAVE